MTDRRALALLAAIMSVVALAIGVAVLATLYHLALEGRQAELAAAARAAAARVGAAAVPGVGPEDDPLVLRLLGARGRLRLAGRDGAGVAFLDGGGAVIGAPGAAAAAGYAGVVDRAIAGAGGVVRLADADGGALIAAFQPVVGRDWAVIAETPLTEVRGRSLAAGRVALLIGLPLIAVANLLAWMLARPILRRGVARQRRFEEMIENMRSGAIILAPGPGDDFTVTSFNRAAEQIEDVDRQAVLGRAVSQVLPAARTSGLVDMLRRVQRTGVAEHVPAALHAGARASLWRELYIYRLPTGELVALVDDVTDRKRAEEALRESEARWRSIIEMHDQAIVIVDQKHDIRFANRAAEALFGKPSQDLIGVPFGYPLVQGEVAEIEILRPRQGIAYTEMRAIPMRWGGEEQFLLFLRDMSAYKRAEGDLRKLFQAIEQSPASVVITDVDGRIEYVNPKFSETTGYTYAEVVGKNPSFLKSGYTAAHEYEALWTTISNGKVWNGEFYNRRKNGEFFWELVSIAPVRDPRGKVTHYVAVKEDISERKATEDRLRHSQKMETIGQLTGGLAHDFNNLLAIIIGNLQLLEEKPEIDLDSRELVADALWSAERGAQLTHRLLAFARRQRLNPKLTDLNDVVGEMTDLLRRTIGEKIRIIETFAPDLWKAMVDRSQLESSLLNLVVNARDAMPAGGSLKITTENARQPLDPAAASEETSPGDYVLLKVSDTGVGMPPEVLERIFEPFFTTKKLGEGSGLGLSMVYGFVRQSGGQIFVDSRPGDGTTVRLYLPRAEVVEVEETVSRRGEAGGKAGGEVILVVEDDARVRKTATTILRKHGYAVVEAADAAAALMLIDTIGRLDLLFTDVVLPNGRNGVELAEEVVRLRPGTRVLFTSGYAMSTLFADSPWDGDVDLLAKPYRRDDLTQRIRALLQRPPTVPPAAAGSETAAAAATATAGTAAGGDVLQRQV